MPEQVKKCSAASADNTSSVHGACLQVLRTQQLCAVCQFATLQQVNVRLRKSQLDLLEEVTELRPSAEGRYKDKDKPKERNEGQNKGDRGETRKQIDTGRKDITKERKKEKNKGK
jgi:hypothetical protein